MNATNETGYVTLQVISKADKLNQWIYQTVSPFLHGKILEMGSGIGNISKYVVENHTGVTLSDFDESYYEYLVRSYDQHPNISGILKIDLEHPDFFNHYAALEENFDTILLVNVVEHLADDNNAIRNCRFLLKNGGTLICLVPAYRFLFSRMDKELGHYRRYTSTAFAKIMKEEKFDVVQSKYFNVLGIAGWLFSGVLFGSKQISQKEMDTFNWLVPVAKILDKLFMNSIGLSVIAIANK